MNVKQLKEIIQSIPDNVIIVAEGRWGEVMEMDKAELDDVALPRFPGIHTIKALVLSNE